MSMRTIFLSRMFGIYCLLMGIFMMTHRQRMWETVSLLVQDKPLMLVLGILTIFGGMALVLVHNIWSGALQVIITLLCWLTLIKGVLILYLPPEMLADFYLRRIHFGRIILLDAAFILILGAYLTLKGFEAERR
jgi:hypothetical protein